MYETGPLNSFMNSLVTGENGFKVYQCDDLCNIHGRPLLAKQPLYDDQSKVRLQPYIRTLFKAVASVPDGIR